MKQKLTIFILLVLVSFPALAQFTRTNQVATREMLIGIADVNRDGLDDLISTGSIRLNVGGGLFGPATTVAGRDEAVIGVIDFNGDGAPDLLVQRATFVANPAPPNVYGPAEYVLLENNGAGGFLDRGKLSIDGAPMITDFNGDGKDDLVAVRSVDKTNRVHATFYRSNWDGTFTVTDQKEFLGFGFWSGPQTGAGVGLAHGDLNGDGHVDLVMRSENEFVFLFGHGDGTFDQLNRFFPGPAGGGALDIVDVDGDGKLDIVFMGAPQRINVMFGDGFGHFPRAAFFDVPEEDSIHGVASYAVGKFTGSQPEIATVTDGGTLLILSAVTGTIKITSRTPTSLYRQNIYSGVFEKPGKRDLLAEGFTQAQLNFGSNNWDTYEGHVFLAPAHSTTTDLQPAAPAPLRRTRAGGPRVTAEGFSVSISNDCSTYSDHWTLLREGFFYNDLSPAPGRLLEAAVYDDAIHFRLTPDGSQKNVPQVRDGIIEDTKIGLIGNADGVDPCGKTTIYKVTVSKD